jgi:hypothetical protein
LKLPGGQNLSPARWDRSQPDEASYFSRRYPQCGLPVRDQLCRTRASRRPCFSPEPMQRFVRRGHATDRQPLGGASVSASSCASKSQVEAAAEAIGRVSIPGDNGEARLNEPATRLLNERDSRKVPRRAADAGRNGTGYDLQLQLRRLFRRHRLATRQAEQPNGQNAALGTWQSASSAEKSIRSPADAMAALARGLFSGKPSPGCAQGRRIPTVNLCRKIRVSGGGR